MLQRENFREYAHKVADKMADYLENVEDFEVLSKIEPRQIFDELHSSISLSIFFYPKTNEEE